MNKYEFLKLNGFVETTDEFPTLKFNPISMEPQRWFKSSFNEHISHIPICESDTLEYVVKIIMAECFRAGSVYGKKTCEKQVKTNLEKQFKILIKKQFPYVK